MLRGYAALLPAIALCAAQLLATARGASAEAPGALTQDAPPLVVVCDDDYPPYAFRDPSGKLVGIVPDLWKEWEKASGSRAALRGMPWAKALAAFDSGEADVIDTIFETPERKLRYDFTSAYAKIDVPVFIHKSISGIASPDDLAGFKVAVKAGDASIGQLEARGVSDLVPYQSYEEIVKAAARLDTRIFCVDKPPALYYLYKLGIDRDFRIAFALDGGEFHRAVKKERQDLFVRVSQGFSAIPAAESAAIERKWLGSEIGRGIDLRLLLAVGAGAIIVAAALLGLAWALRRRVRTATAELREKVALLEKSEMRNRAALEEKELLLKEIHHRVKNNLQIISSLIRLKAEAAMDDERALPLIEDIQMRIQSMAHLHELLYHSDDFGSIDAGVYLAAIARELSGMNPRVSISCEAIPFQIGLDEALPLGLLGSELLVNALKHAFPEGQGGTVRLSLREREGRAVLRVEDDGVGLGKGIFMSTSTGLGFTIVRSLAKQLRADLGAGGPPGFWVELSFALPARAAARPGSGGLADAASAR